MDNDDVKTTKTEVVHARITPREKIFMNDEIAFHHFSSQAEMVSLGLKLMIHNYAGLFPNIARDLDEFDNYAIVTKDQYERLIDAYKHLSEAQADLKVLTDNYYPGNRGDYNQQSAPNEYKDILRDFLMPLINRAIKDYEDRKHMPFDDRFTEPDDLEEYMEKYPGSAKDYDNE